MAIIRYALLCTMMLASLAPLAENSSGVTNKTKPIIGFPPFMKSIGSISNFQNQSLYDLNGEPVTSVNDIVFIPSILCQHAFEDLTTSDKKDNENIVEEDLLSFYHFIDQDFDECNTEINSNLTWYKLKVPDEKNWSEIKSWEQLEAFGISKEYLVDLVPESPFRPALKVPNEAIGHRIGFIYTPMTVTGKPMEGLPIKVWDLDYFFGQNSYDRPGIEQVANDGEKISKIEKPSGGGVIVAEILPPSLNELRIAGILMQGEALEVKYEFISNTINDYEDVSRFWWGREGTTSEEAHFYNSKYSTDPFSPKLTEEDIASVHEVSVLPIKSENGFLVVGQSQTVKSDDPNNEIAPLPKIENLQFGVNADEIRLFTVLGATYTFNNGGNESLEDKSIYRWYLYHPSNGGSTSSSGVIKNSGRIPELTISQDKAGFIVELTVEAKDQFARSGGEETITSVVESLERIEANYEELLFTIADPNSQQMQITALYSSETMVNVTSIGKWSSNDPDIIVTDKGIVSISKDNTTTKTSSIKFSLNGLTLDIPVTIKASEINVSDIHFTSAARDEIQIIGQKATVSYRFDNGGNTHLKDNSVASFYFVDNSGNTTTIGQTSQSRPGHFESIAIDPRYEGQVLYVDITPKDQFGIEGKVQTESVLISKLLALDIFVPNIYISIPTELKAIARFSNGLEMDVTDHGDWTSPDEPFVEFIKNGKQRFITARHGILKGIVPPAKASSIIEFDFSTEDNRIAFTEKNVEILSSNMNNMFGKHTEHALELVISNQQTGIFRPWGDEYLTSIQDENDTLLLGSDGGSVCGFSQNCDFDLLKVNDTAFFEVALSKNGEITSFSWQNSKGKTGFTGSAKSNNDSTYNHYNLGIGDLVGLIFYAEGTLNSNNNKIIGIRFVYKLNNP